MTTFALVHGAWHGTWCWTSVEPELRASGFEVRSIELPCDDPAATFTTYATSVAEGLEGVSDDLVLVGHSLAGLTIPLVPALRPVRRLVFLCALIAEPGRSLVDQAVAQPEMLIGDFASGTEADEQGRLSWIDPQAAHDILFDDCTDADAAWAFAHLRPQGTAPYAEPCPLDALPTVARSYIVCAGDRLVNPAWSRAAARERLGIEAIELPGSHSPFLSRPAALAEVLVAEGRRAAAPT